MKLINDCSTVELDGELILVPIGKAREKVHGIIRFNETAAFIVNCLTLSIILLAFILSTLLFASDKCFSNSSIVKL